MLTEPHRGEGLVQQGGSLLDERLRRPYGGPYGIPYKLNLSFSNPRMLQYAHLWTPKHIERTIFEAKSLKYLKGPKWSMRWTNFHTLARARRCARRNISAQRHPFRKSLVAIGLIGLNLSAVFSKIAFESRRTASLCGSWLLPVEIHGPSRSGPSWLPRSCGFCTPPRCRSQAAPSGNSTTQRVGNPPVSHETTHLRR